MSLLVSVLPVLRRRASASGRGLAVALLAALCLGALPRQAGAQMPSQAQPRAASPAAGIVTGVVVDPATAPTPGAAVILRSPAGFARETRTDARGVFVLDRVSPGHYDLMVVLDGFRADAVPIIVRAGVNDAITLALQLSAVTESLVVSASYVETPLSEAPAGTVVFSASDLAVRQITTVGQALSMVPGATVAANGGPGSVTSLFTRGGESDFTLVLVDGVKLNSFGGGFNFGHLTAGGVSSLEVVRGPQSAVFGADAIGGVVQVRTALGGPPMAAASYEAGGFGTSRAAAGTTGTMGAFAWGAHVERLSSDGWTDAAPGTAAPVSNDDFEGTTASLAASWTNARGTTVRLTGRAATSERGNPGPFGSNPIGAFLGVNTIARGTNDLALGSVAITHAWNPQTAVRVQGSWMQQRSDYTDVWGDSTARTGRWSGHAQLDRALGRAVAVSTGIDVAVERADSTYITGAAAQEIPIERRVAGYFAEARVRAGSRLSATAGLRLEHIVRGALEADPFAWTPRPALASDAIVSPNPRVAVNYDLQPASSTNGRRWSRVYASAGTGIRVPDAFEIAFTDNPGLLPERVRSAEFGAEQALFGGRFVAGATTFLNEYDDLIVAVGRLFAGSSRYRTDNIANARARGLELSTVWRAAWGLEARAAYTFVDSDVLAVDDAGGTAPTPFSVGDQLLRRPRHQASFSLVVSRSRWTAFASAAGRGRVLDVEPNYGAFGGLFRTPGFTVVDAGASARLGRAAELLIRAGNLLDRRYENVFGYPSPGRTLTVGVRVAAGR